MHPAARVPDEEDAVVDFGKLASKAKGLADEHGDKISSAVAKATDVVDQRTGGKHRDKLQKVAAAAERLDKKKQGSAPEGPPSASAPPPAPAPPAATPPSPAPPSSPPPG